MTLALIGLALVGGYVASIFTWPAVRTFIGGVEAEANKLRDRARAIEDKLRGL